LTSHSLEFLWYNSESPKRAVVDKVQATWKSILYGSEVLQQCFFCSNYDMSPQFLFKI
jgi:hypothetical protein